MSYYLDLEEAVLNGQEEEAVLLVQKLIDDKPDPTQIKKSMSDGIIRASENWTQGSYSSANILLADDKPLGRIIIATVAGNVHIIGKALIGALLEATGFEVIDLGENVTRDMFKEKIKELKPDILALGCYTLDAQHELKKLLSEIDMAGLRSNLRVIIGGHSTSQALADQVGADAWASNLLDTIEKAKNVIPKN
jgi:trimethylamine corrinoid protein